VNKRVENVLYSIKIELFNGGGGGASGSLGCGS